MGHVDVSFDPLRVIRVTAEKRNDCRDEQVIIRNRIIEGPAH